MIPPSEFTILDERRQSGRVSSWNEYLCLQRLSSNEFEISVCGYEILGERDAAGKRRRVLDSAGADQKSETGRIGQTDRKSDIGCRTAVSQIGRISHRPGRSTGTD